MKKGIRLIPSLGEGVQYIESAIAPTSLDVAYPISTIWVNTASSTVYLHIGAGAWTQIGGPGESQGDWGTGELKTIAGGVITVEKGKWYKIDTQDSAASDDLDTINGLSAGNEIMISAANDARTVVLKNGTGNLSIRGDISLNEAIDRVRLIHDGTNLVEASSRP